MTRTALLFDLDGTLIDSIGLLVDCMEYAFDGRSRAPTRAEWIAGIGTPLRTQLAEWSDRPGEVEDLVSRYREYQDLHLERLTTPFDGVVELIAWAHDRGHPLAIVTSKGRGMTDRSLAHVGMQHFFDVVVTVESTIRHKPLPDPVQHALGLLGVPPHLAMFAGDSPHDLFAGRAAGVCTVGCEWGPFTRAQLEVAAPHHLIASVSQLRVIVESFEHSNLPGARPVQSGDFHEDHARFHGDHTTL